METYYTGQVVVLTKKKENGYPHHKEIGDLLEIIEVVNNPKYVRLLIKGNRRVNDSYWIHESFVSSIDVMRDKHIDKLLSDELEESF